VFRDGAISRLQQKCPCATREAIALAFLPEKPGEYAFACQMGVFRGKLVVE
jgi:plastocyanin domain-containing protein